MFVASVSNNLSQRCRIFLGIGRVFSIIPRDISGIVLELFIEYSGHIRLVSLGISVEYSKPDRVEYLCRVMSNMAGNILQIFVKICVEYP